MGGFGALALEVLYARMFALVFHNSTYSFGLVVAGVPAGLVRRFAAGRLGRALVEAARGSPLVGFRSGPGDCVLRAVVLVRYQA